MIGRYERQMDIFGEEGQTKLSSARVGIAGCGGLGVNLITQLAVAGVNHYVLADGQVAEISNLNRQFIYAPYDCRPKASVSGEWILALNPLAEVEAHAEPVTVETRAMFARCDVLVDCLDNMESRMVLSDLSEEMGIPLVHAGVSGTHGQIAVCVPGRTPSLRQMIGTVGDPEGTIPSVGAAVSTIAGMEALEVLKVISGLGSQAVGKLITIDMDDWTTETIEF